MSSDTVSEPAFSFVSEFVRPEMTDRTAGRHRTFLKYGSLALFLCGSLGDQVLIKRATYAANSPAALTMLTALLGTLVYPILVLGCVLAKAVRLDQLKVPWWKPAFIAFCWTLHHLLLNIGAGGHAIPGVIVAVLVKSVVPISMLFNMPVWTLGLHYHISHWAGLVVLMSGVLLTLSSVMKGPELTWTHLGKMALVVLSTVPMAASFVFIEVNLKRVHPDLFAIGLWMWVCIIMAGMTIVLMPLNTLLTNSSFGSMFSDLGDGMACYVLGHTPPDRVNPPPDSSSSPWDCSSASESWWAAMGFMLAFNLAMPVSTRYGGAALMWFVRALTVPLSGILFSMTFIMGKNAKPLSATQIFGLLVVMLGVALFNAQEPTPRLAMDIRHPEIAIRGSLRESQSEVSLAAARV